MISVIVSSASVRQRKRTVLLSPRRAQSWDLISSRETAPRAAAAATGCSIVSLQHICLRRRLDGGFDRCLRRRLIGRGRDIGLARRPRAERRGDQDGLATANRGFPAEECDRLDDGAEEEAQAFEPRAGFARKSAGKLGKPFGAGIARAEKPLRNLVEVRRAEERQHRLIGENDPARAF